MAATEKPHVSFIGLGAMGFGMATHLLKEGYPVTGFDVYNPTLERFSQAGGNTAHTPAAAVDGKLFCVCMVATAQQAQDVLLESKDAAAISKFPLGAVVLLCSTVPCAYVQELGRELVARGRPDILLIDAPVSGGAVRAAAGTLSIMAGASDEAIEKGKPLLQAMSDSDKLYIVNGGIGAGSNMKMCHQVLAANQILSASEGMGFASRLGLDLESASRAIISSSSGWSWMLENRMPRILHPEHQPVASAVSIIIKDTGIITLEARRGAFPTHMTSAAEQVYFSAVSRGWGADDDGSLIRCYAQGGNQVQEVGGGVTGLAETDEEKKIALVVGLLKGIHLCSAAEALAFAHHVGLDLDQVFELCIHAAGSSSVLRTAGPAIMALLRGDRRSANGSVSTGESSSNGEVLLQSYERDLKAAVEEAQRLKTPLFLGGTALNLIRMALRTGGGEGVDSEMRSESIVTVWR